MKHLFKAGLVLWMLHIFFMPLGAQPKYVIEWIDTLDTGTNDDARGIAVDDRGNVYVTGFSTIGGATTNNYLTMKYDSSGNILWADTLDSGNDFARGVAVDDKGNVYVTGESYISGNYDYLTVRYDSLGNLLWVDTLDNGGYDRARGVAVDNRGNVYVTGSSYISGNNDYLTVRYDSLGNLLRADILDTGGNEGARGVAVDDRGNVYVTGNSYISGNCDYLTVKYDSSGNILWADTLDNGDDDYAYGVAVDDRGNVYVTGESYISGNCDYLTVRYDSLGNLLWADTLDNGGYDYAFGVAVDDRGNVYVTGSSYISGNYDYLTVRYDSLGNLLWADTLDNGGNDRAFGVAVDDRGNVYVTGNSFNGSNVDYLTVKYVKFKDAGILAIVSPDTVYIDSSYIPQIIVKNYSYEDTLSFDISAYIDSAGTYIYTDMESVCNLSAGDSVFINFDQWIAPSNPLDLSLIFSIITPDMNPDNDTISQNLYIREFIPLTIDSAVAYDGTDSVPGIDDDDYVILYFSESTNTPVIDASNIDSVLSLSGGHSWLDGSGALGPCYWNPDGTQILINLTTNISLPTIAVGDTITPDGVTIVDIDGNPCSSTVVLEGSFDPVGIREERCTERIMLNVATIYRGGISFSYHIPKNEEYSICIYSVDGRLLRKVEREGAGSYTGKISGLVSGIYFLRLEQGEEVINRKVAVIK